LSAPAEEAVVTSATAAVAIKNRAPFRTMSPPVCSSYVEAPAPSTRVSAMSGFDFPGRPRFAARERRGYPTSPYLRLKPLRFPRSRYRAARHGSKNPVVICSRPSDRNAKSVRPRPPARVRGKLPGEANPITMGGAPKLVAGEALLD